MSIPDRDIYEEMWLDKIRRTTNKTKRAEAASPTHPTDDHEDTHKAVRAFKSAPVPADGRVFLDEPPEDLRAKVTELLFVDDASNPEHTASDILRLCEAAALAALPEKLSEAKHLPEKHRLAAHGYNEAIATAQANIHSVFGVTQ